MLISFLWVCNYFGNYHMLLCGCGNPIVAWSLALCFLPTHFLAWSHFAFTYLICYIFTLHLLLYWSLALSSDTSMLITNWLLAHDLGVNELIYCSSAEIKILWSYWIWFLIRFSQKRVPLHDLIFLVPIILLMGQIGKKKSKKFRKKKDIKVVLK